MSEEKDRLNTQPQNGTDVPVDDDAPATETGRRARVYTSADFHKRRVAKKPRAVAADQPERAGFFGRGKQTRASEMAMAASQEPTSNEPAAIEQAAQAPVAAEAAADAPAQEQGNASEPRVQVPPVMPVDGADADGESAKGTAASRRMPAVPHVSESYTQVVQPVRTRKADRRRLSPSRIMLSVFTAILAVAIVVFGIFSWNRWLRFDDAADFAGQWYVHGTSTPVLIENDAIKIKDDVAYRYTLDKDDKTIAFSFGIMKGEGHYWFSLDRKHLVIEDGKDFSAAGLFFEDFGWTVKDLFAGITGGSFEPPSGEGHTVLSRVPNDGGGASGPSAAPDRQAAAEGDRTGEIGFGDAIAGQVPNEDANIDDSDDGDSDGGEETDDGAGYDDDSDNGDSDGE